MKKIKQSKKGGGQNFIWSFVMVCFFLGGAVLLNILSNKSEIISKTNQIQTDWKTYTNKIIGLEFQYPASWPNLVPDDIGDTAKTNFILPLSGSSSLSHTYMNYDNMPIDQQYQKIKCEKLYTLKCEDRVNINGSKYTWFIEDTLGGPEYMAMVATGKYILIFNFQGKENYDKNFGIYEKILSSLKILSSTDNIEETQMQELQKSLEVIFAGKTNFESVMDGGYLTGNFKYFSKNFSESGNQGISINVEVYPYEKGRKYQREYEGGGWDVNLDNKVNDYLTLKLETPEIRQFDDMFGPVQTTLNKFGNKNWAVYETAFKPTGAINRNYYTYDEINKQLIFLSIMITDTKKMNISYDYSADKKYIDMKIVYPDYIKNIINQVEQVLGEV